jgi:hypothetical protein
MGMPFSKEIRGRTMARITRYRITRYLIELLLPLPTLLLLASVDDPFAVEAANCGKGAAMVAQAGLPNLTPTIPVIPAPQPTPQPGMLPAPAVRPPETRLECPKAAYIDCMPIVNGTQRPMCTKEYLEWARAHCPGVQVVY